MIPLAAGKAQKDETILTVGVGRPCHAVGSSTWIRRGVLPRRTSDGIDEIDNQAALTIAPSMTTPAVTYFQSATRSLRARATIVVFFRRPPFAFHSVLEPEGQRRVAAGGVATAKRVESAWSEARIAGIARTPCSRLTDPLCQGVGARPA